MNAVAALILLCLLQVSFRYLVLFAFLDVSLLMSLNFSLRSFFLAFPSSLFPVPSLAANDVSTGEPGVGAAGDCSWRRRGSATVRTVRAPGQGGQGGEEEEQEYREGRAKNEKLGKVKTGQLIWVEIKTYISECSSKLVN